LRPFMSYPYVSHRNDRLNMTTGWALRLFCYINKDVTGWACASGCSQEEIPGCIPDLNRITNSNLDRWNSDYLFNDRSIFYIFDLSCYYGWALVAAGATAQSVLLRSRFNGINVICADLKPRFALCPGFSFSADKFL